jgi:hypothetical protein
MCHEYGRRDAPRDVQSAFGLSHGVCPFVGVDTGKCQRLAPSAADEAFVHRRMDAVQREARIREPLLQVGHRRLAVIVEVGSRSEELDRVEAVGSDFEKMLTAQSLTVIEVCRHPKLSFDHFLTWGSAPHPGSVACEGPTPRAAPSRARRARRRHAAAKTPSRIEPHDGLVS